MNAKLEKDIRLVAQARTVGKPQIAYDIVYKKTVTVSTGKMDQNGEPVMIFEKRYQHVIAEDKSTEAEIKRIKRKMKQGKMRPKTIRALAKGLRERQRVAA